MSAERPPRRAPRPARERGQAMLLTVLLLLIGAASIVYTMASPTELSIEADRRTDTAMALAREALIGYAAKDSNRPGSLPCPDTGDDGSIEIFVGLECARYVGRLPWKTLGLPDLRDGYGERLWYAVSREFARNPSCGGIPNGAACPLNSDTAGELTISGTAPASQIVAIVFSPGLVTGSQNRSSTASSPCSTTGTTIVNSLCPANYLEGENGNGLPPADNTSVTAPASASFNDRLLPITNDALFNVVNVRVAKEAIAALES